MYLFNIGSVAYDQSLLVMSNDMSQYIVPDFGVYQMEQFCPGDAFTIFPLDNMVFTYPVPADYIPPEALQTMHTCETLEGDDGIEVERRLVPGYNEYNWGTNIIDVDWISGSDNVCLSKNDIRFLWTLYKFFLRDLWSGNNTEPGFFEPLTNDVLLWDNETAITTLLGIGKQTWFEGRLHHFDCNPQYNDEEGTWYKPCGLNDNGGQVNLDDISTLLYDSIGKELEQYARREYERIKRGI